MEIQLIAIDLDGTALISDNDISPRLARALAAADARGVHVVPVTGRQFKMLPVCFSAPWAKYVVLCNGAEIRTLPDGTLLEAQHLSVDLLAQCLPVLLSLGVPIELSGGGQLHTTPEMLKTILAAPVYAYHRTVLDKRGHTVPDLLAFFPTAQFPFEKINVPYVPDEVRATVLAGVSTLPMSAAWSGPRSLELTHQNATKGKGLAFLCARLGVSLAHVMALGDSGNDISMLQAAGLGVAMGNASDEVKAVARAVTLTNQEDGVAAAVEAYVLAEPRK